MITLTPMNLHVIPVPCPFPCPKNPFVLWTVAHCWQMLSGEFCPAHRSWMGFVGVWLRDS